MYLLRAKLPSHCTSIACKQCKLEQSLYKHSLTDANREVQEVVLVEVEPELVVQGDEDLIDPKAVVLLSGGPGLVEPGKGGVHSKHGTKASILCSSLNNSSDFGMQYEQISCRMLDRSARRQ